MIFNRNDASGVAADAIPALLAEEKRGNLPDELEREVYFQFHRG